MSISGILLNHPDLIKDVSVPSAFIPQRFMINSNWNRKSMTKIVDQDNLLYLAGSQGVWKSEDKGKSFKQLKKGYPESAMGRRTNDILLADTLLFAASETGLFVLNINENKWKKINLETSDPVKKVLLVSDKLYVFSSSHVFIGNIDYKNSKFEKMTLEADMGDEKISLFSLMFDLHSGEIFGLPGRLLYDAAGVMIVFLSFSGIYMWYFPWRKKKKSKAGSKKLFIWFYKHHFKIGIISATLVLIIGVTGIFLLRPLSRVIAGKTISKKNYPGFLPDNNFEGRIKNAIYDEKNKQILLYAANKFWSSNPEFDKPLERLDIPKFVAGHGLSVFEKTDSANVILGSFAGLYKLNLQTKKSEKIAVPGKGRKFVTGFAQFNNGAQFVSTLYNGIIPLGKESSISKIVMPEEMIKNYSMPLWSYLFSLHKGRIFIDLFGSYTGPIFFTLGALFVLITLSGIFDWIYTKIIKPAKGKKKIKEIKEDSASIPEIVYKKETQ